MKLYLLKAKEGDELWEPWYDKSFGHVVRAKNEKQARKIASVKRGDEGVDAWLNPEHSTCEILSPRGEEELIITDFHAA